MNEQNQFVVPILDLPADPSAGDVASSSAQALTQAAQAVFTVEAVLTVEAARSVSDE